MCIFITAIVPSETPIPVLSGICEKHGFSVQEMNNSSLATFVPGSFQFLPIGGMCNCGTALRRIDSDDVRNPHDLTHEIEKLKQKGWSGAKIQRWKAEKERAANSKRESKETGRQEELRSWEGLIKELLSSRVVDQFNLIYHMYGGSVDDERIGVQRLETIVLNKVNTERLAQLDKDVLYRFSRK